jgi:hypothetical protein
MRFRISHPDLLPDLLAFLETRVNLVVQQLDGDHLAVGVLGSFVDGGAREFEGYLGEWRADHPDVVVSRIASEHQSPPPLVDWRLP